MASISPECTELKKSYDECFNKWYSEKFLKGDTTPVCDGIFEKYKACIWKAIKEKNIEKLIEEARQEQPLSPAKENKKSP